MKNILLISIVLLSTTLFSQNNNLEQRQPYIEVNGYAEIKIIPDQIYIAITIHEKWEGKEKITIDSQEQKLKTELGQLGIDLKNLELSDENANYIKVKWVKKDVLAKTKYVLMVKDAQTVRNVFEKLGDIKIYDAKISKVSHSKIEEYKEEVRIKAIKNAKDKANYLLGAIGETVGKALIVREISPVTSIGSREVFKSKDYVNYDSFKSNSTYTRSLNFQKITLSSSIYVKFLIE